MLFRLAYLGVTNTLALLRLLPMSDGDKDVEIFVNMSAGAGPCGTTAPTC